MIGPQTLDEFLNWEPEFPPAVLDRGLMYSGTKLIMYGKYKSMKSMLAQSFALCVARGEPWLGFNTPEGGLSVLYLQLEIPHLMLQKRMKKMVKGKKRHVNDNLVVWTEHSMKLDSVQGQAKLRTQLDKYQPAVLIVDPIYKVLTGNIIDAQQLLVLLDFVDKLIADYDLTVMLVTHSRKSNLQEAGKEVEWGSDDMLGSVILSAWADSIIKVKRNGDLLKASFDVVRHAEETLEEVEYKLDATLHFAKPTAKI